MTSERTIHPDPAELCQDCAEYPCECDVGEPRKAFIAMLVAVVLIVAGIICAGWHAYKALQFERLDTAFMQMGVLG